MAAGASAAVTHADAAEEEDVIAPDLPIIDPHHHMWDRTGSTNPLPMPRFLLPDVLKTLDCGHRIIGTMYVEASSMYRADGPAELKSLGETEFANGVAAMSASGVYGPIRVAAGIVGKVDLTLGDRAGAILDLHKQAAGGRLKGIRHGFAFAGFPLFGRTPDPKNKDLLANPDFRKGFAQLSTRGLVYDGWGFHTQIDQFTDLAKAFPNTTMVLDHCGSPLLIGPDAKPREHVFADWKKSMTALSKLPNVNVKTGGLGMQFTGDQSFDRPVKATTKELLPVWKPYIETCIELFGANRCMFESNFPPDAATCTYRTLWNVFKTIAAKATSTEKTALFSGTAKRVYSLDI